jgi:hypothetical protein
MQIRAQKNKKNRKNVFYCFRVYDQVVTVKKYMAFSTPTSTKSTTVNTVNDEKFAKIYTSDEKTVQLLDNERTIIILKFGSCACAIGIHSYSSGIHCIRIRIDEGYPIFGIRSRNIAPIADETISGFYGGSSPSTYGWKKCHGRVLNGNYERPTSDRIMNQNSDEIKIDSHVYTITLNCDEHRLSMINENTKEQDEMEVDVYYAPLPWCLFIATTRMPARVALI